MSRRSGISVLARPIAATVPSTVATIVAEIPTAKLFLIARIQFGFSRIAPYQRSE